jgi:hypothetical protein
MYNCKKMYLYTYFPYLSLAFVPCDMYIIGLYIICVLKFMYQIYINRHRISTDMSSTLHCICGIYSVYMEQGM